jgi:hypothetical protein
VQRNPHVSHAGSVGVLPLTDLTDNSLRACDPPPAYPQRKEGSMKSAAAPPRRNSGRRGSSDRLPSASRTDCNGALARTRLGCLVSGPPRGHPSRDTRTGAMGTKVGLVAKQGRINEPWPGRGGANPVHQTDIQWFHSVDLSSCQSRTDRQCSSKVQQPGRLTFDLHRPDMTF